MIIWKTFEQKMIFKQKSQNREYNAMQKKVARRRGREENEIAKSVREQFTNYTLDHIVKER